ncbi:TolC family protein [Bacteroidales bacterium OttesenSCG-928-I14]|nr:TolC family protein [Bacteroidales bacterium OttesenSCG-928-I14]
MKHLKYIIAVTLFISVTSIAAQQSLSLEQCREMALENNKQMTIAAENRAKSRFDVKAYMANFFPKISATGNYLFTSASMEKTIPGNYLPTFVPNANGELVPNILTTVNDVPIFKEYAYFPDMDLELKLNGTYTAGLRLEQAIYMGGKITSAYKMSKIGNEIARLNEIKTKAEVILQSDEAYWTYVQTLELEKTANTYKELIEQLLTDVQNAFDAGLKPRNDLLKVQVKQNEAELQVIKAINGVRLARMNLCHVIGLPLTTDIDVSDPLDEILFSDLPEAELTSRPEYEMLSKQIELKDQQIKMIRSEFLPNIGVMGNFGYVNGLKLNGDRLLDKTSFSAVVSASIPLFHWGEGRNKVKSANSERNIAISQRDELAEKMELEICMTRNSFDEAKVELMLTSRSLKQTEENLKESRNRYEVGMETMSDLLEAQTLWQQALTDVVRAKAAVRLSETIYLKAAGRL